MKKALAVLGVLALVAAAGAGAVWFYFEQQLKQFLATPFGTPDSKSVDMPQGTNPRALAQLLEQSKVVADSSMLYAYLRREKLGPKLKAGEYEFEGALTPAQVIEKITSGKVKLYRFTVPEGLRVDEVLPILAASTLHLRSNQRIMRSLLASTAEELRHSSTIAAHPRTAAAAGQKRTREIAQEAAAVVAARLRAKVADPAVGSDSGSEEDDDVVVAPGTYFDVELDSD